MSHDIEKALAYQVKKEIAQRYFRLRKLIEDDSNNLKELIKQLNEIYHKDIKESLLRIYSLLIDEELIKEFVSKLGLSHIPFLKEFKELSQEDKKRLLKNIKGSGWFKINKYSNKLIKAYEDFYEKWQDYFDLKEEILDELAIVKEELDHFKKNYSLDEIMHFLRGLNLEDEAMKGALGAGIDVRKSDSFDQEMALDVDLKRLMSSIPELDKIPPVEKISKTLKKLAKKAYFKNKKALSDLI